MSINFHLVVLEKKQKTVALKQRTQTFMLFPPNLPPTFAFLKVVQQINK